MTREDLEALETKAKAATEGPWVAYLYSEDATISPIYAAFPERHEATGGLVVQEQKDAPIGAPSRAIATARQIDRGYDHDVGEPVEPEDILLRVADAEYIAAAHPETILRLIARIRHLERSQRLLMARLFMCPCPECLNCICSGESCVNRKDGRCLCDESFEQGED